MWSLLSDCRCHCGRCGSYKYGTLGAVRAGFKWLRDPLFIAATGIYMLHKWSPLWPAAMRSSFTEHYLSDLLLVPVALPGVLFLAHVAGLRSSASPLRLIEVLIPLVIWSLAFEFVGPQFLGRGTFDPFDVLFYSIGGLAGWLFWSTRPALCRVPEDSSVNLCTPEAGQTESAAGCQVHMNA